MSNMLNNIFKQLKSFKNLYNKSSFWCKMLILIVLIMLVVIVFKSSSKEGFIQQHPFLFKSGSEVFDKFYAEIYDYLVFNNIRNEYEIGEIVNKTTPTNESKILDIGCGTGHHVASLASKGIDVIGIDISPSMIEKAKENYPNYKFSVGDALNNDEFAPNSFTHIICMYFTIYYIKNKALFFENCMKWLMPGGYLIIHLVNREKFNPILSSENPIMLISNSNERKTTTKVRFSDFAYNSNFQLDEQNNIAKLTENFEYDNSNKSRTLEHILYMPDTTEIVDIALNSGLILYSQVDLLNCQYEYQYLYIFTKPN
jgi:SAM-dependent methyltransferase